MSKNIENINNKDLENICRTCLNNCDVKFIRDPLISNVFYKLTSIHFETNDDLPRQICLKCFEKINEIHEFAFQCLQSHSTLMKCLNNIEQSKFNKDKDVLKYSDEEEFLDSIVKLEENLTFDIQLQSNNNVNNGLEETEVISEYKNDSDEYIVPHAQEINNDQIINCFEDETEEQSNSNSIVNDLCGEINSSNNTVSSDEDNKETRSNEKQYCKPFIRSSNPDDGRVHRNEHRFKCEYCLKSFKFNSYLVDHKRMHTGERPYKCNQCFKAFVRLSHLNNHARIHSGERPYKCKICFKSFAQPNHLKQHMFTHNSARSFKCKVCSKSFTTMGSLKEHMNTHSGERNNCTSCDKSFIYSSSLKKHILKRHTRNQSTQ